MQDHDSFWIDYSLKLAALGKGHVSPNPLVGSVIVKDGKKIGEGYHSYFGGPHAEVNAINSSPGSLEGSTLYCNLEPCCHKNKKTPPCTDLIIEKKIKRVVFSTLDPNPEVSGKGFQKLKDAGIEVEYGILKQESTSLNEKFFKFIQTKFPFIHLKLAQTLDGKLATSQGDSKWISSEPSRKFVHQMRAWHDAVLIGIDTLIQDNAKLNLRYGLEKKYPSPYRIIVGDIQKLEKKIPQLALLTNGPSEKIIFITYPQKGNHISDSLKDTGARVIQIPPVNKKIDLTMAFKELGKLNISSVLIEGGNKISTSLFNDKLVDKLTLFIAPKILGSGTDTVGDLKLTKMADAIPFSEINISVLPDKNIIWQGKPVFPHSSLTE